ncbi:MAG: hypothetical protein ABJA10_00440, partial [Aestuariivirga sp.]
GRKYGVSLCIVTQRPAELDPTILSQCNTVFSMRLTNERDQEILRAGISDAAASLLEFMPTMGAGEAVTFGEGVALPTRIKFDLLPADELPRSNTASFTKNWAKDLPDDSFLLEVVSRWRAQTYNPDSASYSLDDATPPAQPAIPVAPRAAPAGVGHAASPFQPSLAASASSPRPSLLRREGFGAAASAQTAQHPTAPPADGAQQPSLASLIKQFRT